MPAIDNRYPVITPAMREAVEKAAGIGLPIRQIARLIVDPETLRPISTKTLEKHFKNELEAGLAKANQIVSGKLLELAAAGNIHAIIWWEKTRQGRYEKRDFRGMAQSGELDVKPEHLSKLTNEQILALQHVLQTVANAAAVPRLSGGQQRRLKLIENKS